MDAILCDVKDGNKFWSYGEKDAEKLKIFVDKNSVVLDVGCGIGRVEKFLAKYCKEIHGVDVSGRMIRFARNERKECKNCFFHKTNGMDFSIFPDNKFDFVFSIITLQHLEKEDVYIYGRDV
jgi:ubiquinone/menaquinone biosynthesis C-methylase UbiE